MKPGAKPDATTTAGSPDANIPPLPDATSIANWPIDSGTKGGPFDWVGIIGTGQSLSVGWEATAISTTSPFKNVMLADEGPDPKYPIDGSPTAKWVLTPLVEPVRMHVSGYPNDDQYPNDIYMGSDGYGETPHSGFANTLSALWAARGKGDYVTAHSVVGQGAACLAQINKASTGRTYQAGISEARVYKSFADKAGKTYGVAAILFTHGECDAALHMTTNGYGNDLYQFLNDYNADLAAITGQTRKAVLLASQESSVYGGLDGTATELWRAGVAHPGEIVCVGPKYAYGTAPFGGHGYRVHLDGPGYERLGEKYAEVFDYVVNRGAPWKPVGPNKVTRNGAALLIDFDVPNPPLVWDSHLAVPHQSMHQAWAKGRGFEVIDGSSNELTIASVEITGNRVTLTLDPAPSAGTALTLSYAVTPDDTGYAGGEDLGMHGLLRDSDDFEGYASETIDVMVTNGSADITAVNAGGFAKRAAYDIVSATALPDDTIVVTPTMTGLKLSNPWSGPTGKAQIKFHHNHYNYAVHFSMPVP